jgi:FADH2 O2-dependent halogenase
VPPPYGPDVHWFRQDIDSYMFAAAVRYGAAARQRLRITKIERLDGVWLLASDKGERFTARYLVDAGGIRSPLAELYGLREDPPRQRTNSRSMFTHMVGVRPYDQCVPDAKAFGFYNPIHQGTLHHIFDGGWFWVIPFDNYPESTNPLCSVGLTLDRRKYPDADISPEEEFRAFLKRFPSVASQFENARPVREWIRSNTRIQFSSRQAVGDGYCLLPHAAGFIDPLFSSGLTITISFVSNLAGGLIRAKEENDFSMHRFAHLEEWLQYNMNYFDRMVSSAYNSWADFRLWNAWFRIWSLGTFLGTFSPITVQAIYMQTRDPNKLALMEETPYRGVAGNEFSPFLRVFDAAYNHMEAFRAGEITAEIAADRIFRVLGDADFIPPVMRLADPTSRCTFAATVGPLLKNYFWGRFLAPKIVRQTYYDLGPSPLVILYSRMYSAELRRSLRTLAAYTRDHFFTWNREWKHRRYDPPAPARPATPLTDKPPMPPPRVSSAPREESIAAS